MSKKVRCARDWLDYLKDKGRRAEKGTTIQVSHMCKERRREHWVKRGSGCSIDWILFHPGQWRVLQWKLSLRGNLHWAGMSDTPVLTVVILGKAWQQLRGSMAAPSSRWRIQRGWVSTILPPAEDLRNIFLWLPHGVKFSNIFEFWRKKKKDKNIDECRF